MSWAYVLTDLQGTKIGEITNAYERKFQANLSKPSTASFQIRRDNPLLRYLFSEEEDYLLQVWNGSTLEMYGPILTANLAMSEGAPPTVAVTATDPAWRMDMRTYWAGGPGYTQTAIDKALIAQGLIGYQNGRANGTQTGIAGNNDTCGTTGTYTAITGKTGLECIQDLAQGFDGFDWYIEPIATAVPVENNPYMPFIGVFRAAALVGVEKPSVVFEFGIGRHNAKSVNYLRDQTTRANIAINISEEGTVATVLNPTPIYAYSNVESYERFGVYETMAELSGVPTLALREQYTQEVVKVRNKPRRVLAMTSDIDDGTGRVPLFGRNKDYWLGDTITARAYANNESLFNGKVRVYGCEVALNDAGTATYTPILLQE